MFFWLFCKLAYKTLFSNFSTKCLNILKQNLKHQKFKMTVIVTILVFFIFATMATTVIYVMIITTQTD